MKDIVVLFDYFRIVPNTIGGDSSWHSVGLDCVDGQLYDLLFFDTDDDPDYFGIVTEVSILGEITYDDMRKLAQRAYEDGLLKDPAKYDALNQSNWMEYAQMLSHSEHYHFP